MIRQPNRCRYARAARALRKQARTLEEFVRLSRLPRELGGRPSGHPQHGRPLNWERLIAESGLERIPT